MPGDAGQCLTVAKAIAPDLVSVAAGRETNTAALDRWAQRFTPSTAANPPDGHWLDITGCARLWRGAPCQAAIAEAFGAAWTLARRTAVATENI